MKTANTTHQHRGGRKTAWLALFTLLAWPALGQDLQVVSVSPGEAGIDVGGSTKVTATLRLNGNPGAYFDNVTVVGYKSHNGDCSAPVPPNSFSSTFARIEVGPDYSLSFTLMAEPGELIVYAVVKILHADSNPANNCLASDSIRIRYPDLLVAAVQLAPPANGITPGQTLNISVLVENREQTVGQGASAAASLTRYYLQQPPNNPVLIEGAETEVPALGVNETFTCTLSFVPNLPLGTYLLYARVDDAGQVLEGDETNNDSPAMELKIVEYCTQVAGIMPPLETVGVNDLLIICGEITSPVTPENVHMNLVASEAPFPEVINVQDYLAALICWGPGNPATGGQPGLLRDFWVIQQGSAYSMQLDVAGTISAIETFIRLPAGFQLTQTQTPDLLQTGYTAALNLPANSHMFVNEVKTLYATGRSLNGTYGFCQWNTQLPFDLTHLEPLGEGETMKCGIAVKVIFSDGSAQQRQMKYPFADFPDASLRAHVAALLGLAPQDAIPLEPLADVVHLNLGHKGIADLDGVEQFANLQVLRMANNQVQHLPDLGCLSGLILLDARSNGLVHWPVLPASLQVLWLSNNALTRVEPAVLPNLRDLDVAENRLNELPSLAVLSQLKHADFSRNRLGQLPPLPASLETLQAAHNHLVKVLPFSCQSPFRSLQWIDLSHNQLFDLQGLVGTDDCFRFAPSAEADLRYNNLDRGDCSGLRSLSEELAVQFQPQNHAMLSCSDQDDGH